MAISEIKKRAMDLCVLSLSAISPADKMEKRGGILRDVPVAYAMFMEAATRANGDGDAFNYYMAETESICPEQLLVALTECNRSKADAWFTDARVRVLAVVERRAIATDLASKTKDSQVGKTASRRL